MSAKVFIDTNILVYAHDIDAGKKHQTAHNLLYRLAQDRAAVLSMQVLQEFYVTVTRKLSSPLPKKVAREIVNDLAPWCVATSPEEIKEAFRIEDQAKIGFWDALIVAAAIKAGASQIFSEDLNPGQRIAGVLVENPFAS
ncbi:MAG: PIN domain-containing protein [Terracidiphilus sp.]